MGRNSCLNWPRFALGWISLMHVLVEIRRRPKSIPEPMCCRRHGYLTYSQLPSVTGMSSIAYASIRPASGG